MNNKTIADKIQLYSQLLELQGSNSFKVRAYKNAYPIIRNFKGNITEKSREELLSINGLGENIVNKIQEIEETGTFPELTEAEESTPKGLLEMMKISGLGPAKVKMLWQDYGIDSLEDLITFANSGELEKIKGFGAKTVTKIVANAKFLIDCRGKILLSTAEEIASLIEENVAPHEVQWQADWYHKNPVVATMSVFLHSDALVQVEQSTDMRVNEKTIEIKGLDFKVQLSPEKEVRKEPSFRFDRSDIIGLVHMHTTYSDGGSTIEEMAAAAQERGLEYMLVTDHSRSAGYANGLQPDRVSRQQKEIDDYNKNNPDFQVFKGIESDILADGSLDYTDTVLKSFDAVIASIHSGLDMDAEQATSRLITAIENPYTTILGHPTARLLLRRPGYAPDMHKLIDAAVSHHVAIEINSNPRRLDIDYSWLSYAQEKGLFISINPDAHYISGIDDIRFGVWMAQKVDYPPELIINTYSAEKFKDWIKTKREK